MRVLVAYGSKRGGTAGLAEAVGDGLAAAGHEVDVLNAGKLDSIEKYDAVVVGGALYMFFWHREARRFVKRFAEALQQVPVWFFSSGPLDDSASKGEIPPTRHVRGFMRLARARGHVTFGGRLSPEAKSRIPTRGDWRDMNQARAWGRSVATELAALAPRPRVHVPRALPTIHRAVAALCLFTGITAVWGGLALVASPEGSRLSPPLSVLEHSPFASFLLPGLLLFAVVGLGNLVAAGFMLARRTGSELVAGAAGLALTVWIVTQMALLRAAHPLHWLYLAIGVATVGGAAWLWLEKRSFPLASRPVGAT